MHFWNIKKLQLCSEIFDNFVSDQQRMSEHEYYIELLLVNISEQFCLIVNMNCTMHSFCSWTLIVCSIHFVNMKTTPYWLWMWTLLCTLWTWTLLCTSCEHEPCSALLVNMNPTLHFLWTWTLLCIVCELLGGTTQALTSHWDVWFPLKSILVSG